MCMKHGWWKSLAILCLILQVGVLATGLLHFVLGRSHEHHHDGCENACPGFPHMHLASPEETGGEQNVHLYRSCGNIAALAETTGGLSLWAASGNVVPCPSEQCLICSLSDLVRSSDVSPAGELLVYIRSVRCSPDLPAFRTSHGIFRPCLPRGPPVVS